MTSAIRHTTFDEYHKTLSLILDNIDKAFKLIKDRQKNLLVWHEYPSYKDFLKIIEKEALSVSSKELGIASTTIRDRWHVLTLPVSVYSAMEEGVITFSKAKLMTVINFDFENNSDILIAEEIVQKIISGLTNAEIKELIQKRSSEVWNGSQIIMERLAEQNDIYQDSKY